MRVATLFIVVLLMYATGCDQETRDARAAAKAAAPAMPVRFDSTVALAHMTEVVDSACAAPPSRTDRLICSARVGPLARGATRASLDTLFDRVRDDSVFIEGDAYPSTVVNSGRPDSAVVLWVDRSRAAASGITSLGPAWHTPDGLQVGSSMTDLLASLGPQLRVLGFGWDYGGTVILGGTRLENSGIFFRTAVAQGADSGASARVKGDKPYDPSSPDVRALRLTVRSIDILWK